MDMEAIGLLTAEWIGKLIVLLVGVGIIVKLAKWIIKLLTNTAQ
jgi:hypothetical protein